jgi:hypothetical protein
VLVLAAAVGALSVLTVGAGAANATASVVTFNDRSTWNVAVGGTPDVFVDFESFTDDAVFGLAPVDVGPFTLTESSGEANLFDRIDVPPYFAAIAPDNSPNGSTFAMGVLGINPDVGTNAVTITFDQPVNKLRV